MQTFRSDDQHFRHLSFLFCRSLISYHHSGYQSSNSFPIHQLLLPSLCQYLLPVHAKALSTKVAGHFYFLFNNYPDCSLIKEMSAPRKTEKVFPQPVGAFTKPDLLLIICCHVSSWNANGIKSFGSKPITNHFEAFCIF